MDVAGGSWIVESFGRSNNQTVPRSTRTGSGGEDVVGVDDRVGVALLGEEALPVRRVFGVDRVAGHHRVEVGLAAVGLRAQYPAEPLRLLLTGAERARHLDRHRCLRQVD